MNEASFWKGDHILFFKKSLCYYSDTIYTCGFVLCYVSIDHIYQVLLGENSYGTKTLWGL